MALTSASILLFALGTTIAYDSGTTYLIRTYSNSNLVLDGSGYEVKIQNYVSGNNYQLWYLESTDSGKYVIVNKGTGKALDIAAERSGAYVVTNSNRYSSSQKWYVNSDGTIVNSVNYLAADVYMGRISAGWPLITYQRQGTNNQKFRVVSIRDRIVSYGQRW